MGDQTSDWGRVSWPPLAATLRRPDATSEPFARWLHRRRVPVELPLAGDMFRYRMYPVNVGSLHSGCGSSIPSWPTPVRSAAVWKSERGKQMKRNGSPNSTLQLKPNGAHRGTVAGAAGEELRKRKARTSSRVVTRRRPPQHQSRWPERPSVGLDS